MKAPSWVIRREKLIWCGLLGALLVGILWWAVGPFYIGVPRVPRINTYEWADQSDLFYVATSPSSPILYIAAKQADRTQSLEDQHKSTEPLKHAHLPVAEYNVSTGESRRVKPAVWAGLDASYSQVKISPYPRFSAELPRPPRWEVSADGRAMFFGAKSTPDAPLPSQPSQADLLRAGAKSVPLTGAVPLWHEMAFTPDGKSVCILSAASFYLQRGGLPGEGPSRVYVGPVTVNFANSFTGEMSPDSFVLSGSRDVPHLMAHWSTDGRYALVMEASNSLVWIIDTSKIDLPGRSK